MSSWASVRHFLDHLGEPEVSLTFEQWFRALWENHTRMCYDAAAHKYAFACAVSEADSLVSLRRLLASKASEVGLEPNGFIEYVWERAVKDSKFNDDE